MYVIYNYSTLANIKGSKESLWQPTHLLNVFRNVHCKTYTSEIPV